MSNIDKQALRDLATALDGDDWHAEGNSVYGGAYKGVEHFAAAPQQEVR